MLQYLLLRVRASESQSNFLKQLTKKFWGEKKKEKKKKVNSFVTEIDSRRFSGILFESQLFQTLAEQPCSANKLLARHRAYCRAIYVRASASL